VGAPQKRFAWSIGFMLSVVMFLIIVVFEWMTPIKIAICVLCLMLLFSEAAFGICIGCIVYHWVYKKSPHYCPGNVCEIKEKEEIQKVSKLQLAIVSIFLIFIVGITTNILKDAQKQQTEFSSMKCASGKCGSGM